MEVVRSDLDQFFAYSTHRQIEIRDSKLGLTYIILQVLLMSYIVFYVFLYEEAYFKREHAPGTIVTHVRGDTAAVSSGKPGTRYFSAGEIAYPGLQNGHLFITTRMRVENQSRGLCHDLTMPCETDADCSVHVGGTCTDSFFCYEPSWCQVDEKPEIYEVESSDLQIWTKSSIQFISLAPEKVFSTEDNHAYPELGYNAFTVRDLLMRCEPAPVRFEEISELGAAIEVQFRWECDVGDYDCRPEVHVRRVDTVFDPDNIGFSFSHAEYVSENQRMLNQVSGVRIYMHTLGTGRKVHIQEIIFQFSINMSIMVLAEVVADLMLKVMAARKRYLARKYVISPDFGDYRKKAEELQSAASVIPHKLSKAEKDAQDQERAWLRQLDEAT